MRKRFLAILLSVVMIMAIPLTAFAESSPAATQNRYKQANPNIVEPIKSYLYENESGGLTRVEFSKWQTGQIVVENYDSSFRFLSGQTIPAEMDDYPFNWGGFFAGENWNFFIFGHSNYSSKGDEEVIRVVKYSKDWKRLGQARVYNADIRAPFDNGTLRVTEYNGELYIYTCYLTQADPNIHNAFPYKWYNLPIVIRESDMTVTDCSPGSIYRSCDQFVIVDQQQRIVTLDYSVGSPRGATLMVYDTKAGRGKFSGSASSIEVQSIPDDGNIFLGGLAETSNGYAVAYGYGEGGDRPYDHRSLYFAYLNKSSLSVEKKVISGVGTTKSFLVPTGLNGGWILWNDNSISDAYTQKLYYTAYSDGGKVGEVKTASADLSDCQPIVYNGKVVWYTTNNSTPTFYQLDENGVTAIKAGISSSDHSFADVSETDYFFQPVIWAVEKGITNGTSSNTFSPNKTCTAAEILTFMWRTEGSPTYEDFGYGGYTNRFTKVKESDYFYGAAVWADLMEMVSADFNPNAPCTRAMAVEYLWKMEYMQYKSQADVGSRFTDVPANASYAKAVAWAVEKGITNGTSSNTFSPDQICTRGQIVTFLYRLRG